MKTLKATNTSYLRVMRREIVQSIAPDLRSDEAKRSAHILLGAIDELLKREDSVPRILADAIPRGIGIGRLLATDLRELGIPVDPAITGRLDALQQRLGSELSTRPEWKKNIN